VVVPGISVREAVPLPLRSRTPLNQLKGLGERCKLLPVGFKTNLVHSKAVRKPLVAIILRKLTGDGIAIIHYCFHLSGVP